ncbi:MAG: 2-oxoglutarate dehydrogenase E1 component [Phycisphaerales bacterium]|nr:2-oxoglutarate dehydrogenase E1 component [Phycisphaerales bacterium]
MAQGPKAVLPSVNGWNADYLEGQYERWKRDPRSVPADVASFLAGFDLAAAGGSGGAAAGGGPSGGAAAESGGVSPAQAAVTALIERYRRYGHMAAQTDPFGREPDRPEFLNHAHHGLSDEHLDRPFDAGLLSPGGAPMTLRAIIGALEQTYCGAIGVEFTHISNEAERRWLIERMEGIRNRPSYGADEKREILRQLQRSEMFELFCAKRYKGAKRFSLEGGESLIPMLDRLIACAGDRYEVSEIVFGMAHRGRLNVLTNIMGKTYEMIFTEFDDAWTPDAATGGGDVKYHRGYSSNRLLPSGRHVWLSISSNPSHLESVNAVVLGRCRAKQRLARDYDRRKKVPVLIHGDAAMIGQGVVAECFNMSQLDGYKVGGTVHVVINNLIGFTTGPDDARSSRYCTDSAKIIECPVFHVNGEDPEACVLAIELALEYRMRFGKDAVVDMVCYRRHGHNETDEAAFTQPLLYNEIKGKPSVVNVYAQRLGAEGVITDDQVREVRASLDENLDRAFLAVKQVPVDPTPDPGHQQWEGQTNEWSFAPVDTGVARDVLAEIASALGRWPEGFTPHEKLVKILQDRARCVSDDLPLDFGAAEALAVGSLLKEGTIVRLSGQDCRRGTFSHRHAALRDKNTNALFVPLNHLSETPGADAIRPAQAALPKSKEMEARYWVYDSPLSEFAVLAFEYGYSITTPNALVMWEAQFGDFANGAQVAIDQYLASAEIKWDRWSGLVLLLPHGYEGQGPEHSSARLERFLQLCADHNMQVIAPTSPAQYFHALRRQVKRSFRKPLVVMTPKSLLRAPFAASRVAELMSGTFQEIIDDPALAKSADPRAARSKVRRVILCSGKVYYDLAERRAALKRDDLAIVRVEQLYPLHTALLGEIMKGYPKDVEVVWVQEEPKNMGGYQHVFMTLFEEWGWQLPYVGRPASATPATGSPRKHFEQLQEFLADAVGALAQPVAAPAH